MKCEKCNDKEANFFYTVTVNGKTTQRHLCSECAAQEGLDKAFSFSHSDLFDDFFSEPFGLLDSFWREPFGRRGLFGGLMPAMMTMPRSLFAPAETQEAQPEHGPAQTEAETKIPADAGEEVKTGRELKALKHQLHEAVKAEDFEKAIELRDKIRKLEQ